MTKEEAGTQEKERAMDVRTITKIQKHLGGMVFNKDRVIERMTVTVLSIANCCVDLGMLALYLKANVEHGEFLDAIDLNFIQPGICSERTVQNCMRIAKFVLDQPKNANIADLASLGTTKQLMMASASDDDIDLDEGTYFGIPLADWRALKINELKAEIENWKKKDRKNREELVKGREQLADAKDAIKNMMDMRSIRNKGTAEIQRILDINFDTISTVLDAAMKEPIKLAAKGSITKETNAQINGFLTAVESLLGQTIEDWAKANSGR